MQNKDTELLQWIINDFFADEFTREEINESFSRLSRGVDLTVDEPKKMRARFGEQSFQELVDEGILDYDSKNKKYSLNPNSSYVRDVFY